MKLLILGGYGFAGAALCRAVLTWRADAIVIAGRDGARARAAAEELRADFPGREIGWAEIDAGDRGSLRRGLAGASVVAVLAPVADRMGAIGAAAIAAGADLIEITERGEALAQLEPLAGRAEAAGCRLISQAGCHPGLPAVMIRHVAPWFETMARARVGMAFRGGFESVEGVQDMFQSMDPDAPAVLDNGRWRRPTWRDTRAFAFGAGFGRKACYPLPLRELHQLDIPGWREGGLFAAGFNWFIDMVVFPLALIAHKLRPGLGIAAFSRMFVWADRMFSRGAPGIAFRLEAEGARAGAAASRVVVIRADDGMRLTALVLVAVLNQRAHFPPGLQLQGLGADPGRLLRDLAAMGAEVSEAGA